jgi:ABC-2 type transport system permease protein
MLNYPKVVETLNIHSSVFLGIYNIILTTIMFMMPVITMRIFAEEKKGKTMEFLMTSPITVAEIVLGKFLASFTLFALIILLTVYMPVYASFYSDIDWGIIWSSYLGVLLIGSVFLAIGLFASSLTENQIVAALISYVIIMLFIVVQWIANLAEGQLAIVLNYLALPNHIGQFLRGVVSTKDVIYYLSFTALGLFMTFRVIESKRWA